MKLNAIVIDDSPVQLLASSKLIRRNEHLNLIGAYTNPFLGLSAVNSMDVDLVLLDIEMPDIDGFSLKELFNNQAEVIMYSTKPEFEFQAYSTGAIDFLNKPISVSRLNYSISKVMEEEKYSGGQEKVFTAIAS